MKKHFIVFFSFVLTLLYSNQIFAQTYRSGFIIENSGDTIAGQIKYRAGKRASLDCVFQNSENKKFEYKPGDIIGYRIDEGKYYISNQIPINGESRLLFAEFLIKGNANLYYVNFRNADHYFIESDNSGLIELTEPKKNLETSSGDYVSPPKFKGKLIYSLSDYDQIQNEVKDVSLNHTSLIKLVKTYNYAVCDSAECIVFEKKTRKPWIDYRAAVGYTLSSYNFGQLLDSEYGPGFTAGFSFILNNIVVSNERFTLQLDLNYQKQFQNNFISGKKTDFGEYVSYEDRQYFVNPLKDGSQIASTYYVTSLQANTGVNALKIPVTINYSGLSKTFRPYFGAGFSTMFVLSQNDEFIYEHFKEIYGKSIPTFLFGIKSRIGISAQLTEQHSLFFEVDYDYLLNYNINNFYRLRVNTFQFQFCFRF